MFKRTFLAISFLCCIATNSWADTYSAASCSQSDVQAAINASSEGDTVSVSSGNCTWSSPVSVMKGITLQGAGPTSTVITISGSNAFTIGTANAYFTNVRLTGFGLTGSSSSAADISIEGNFTSLRVDHLRINTGSSKGVWVNFVTSFNQRWSGAAYEKTKMLFDHIEFINSSGLEFILIYGRGFPSWQEDDGWGTDNFIFIEDSTFTWTGGSFGIVTDTDIGNGARFVFRHNTVTNGTVQMHDTSSQRSQRAAEIYGNTITASPTQPSWPAIGIRGGTYLVYNNTINGYDSIDINEIFRLYHPPCETTGWGICCDQSGSTKFYEDALTRCTGGDRRICYSSSDCSGIGTCDISCTTDAGAIKCVKLDGSGTGNYPCRDQTGWGKDDANGANTSSPVYWWRNGSDAGCATGGTCTNTYPFNASGYSGYMTEGVEYCKHSPVTSPNPVSPGTCNGLTLSYTPYTYPHPWTQGTSLLAPQNLRIMNP